MVFGINTMSDISILLYVNLRQFWNITSGIYAKYHVQIMLLFVYTTTCKRFVIFTCRYFKLSWNSTALSQSNCRNFSCTGISNNLMQIIILLLFLLTMELLSTPQLFAYESVLLFSESFLQPVENEKRKYIIL